MDVSLTAEQREWCDAVARLTADRSAATADGLSAIDGTTGWRHVVDLGVPALRTPIFDGIPAGIEAVLAVEQVARGLCPLPVFGQAVIAPELLVAAGASETLARVIDGDLRIAPTLTSDLRDFGRVGAPAIAFDAADATHALLMDDGPTPKLVAVELGPLPLAGLDLTRHLVPVEPDAPPAELELGDAIAADRLERAHALALTGFAADILGAMQASLAEATEYVSARKQFGVPVGSFQAVQHLLADALVSVEGARSCVWHAAWGVDRLPVEHALSAARVAKAYCSAEGLRVVEATVQAFGGIAITWEHTAHVRLRRVLLDRQCFGDESDQNQAIATQRLAAAAA